MINLKPCPMETEALDIIESLLDVADMKCTGPLYADAPPHSGMCHIPEDDATILRQYIADCRVQPANKPLTLDELRELWNKDKGKPFWIKFDGDECNGYMELHHYIEDGYFNAYYFGSESDEVLMFSDYGKTWVAFTHKP